MPLDPNINLAQIAVSTEVKTSAFFITRDILELK